MSKVSAECVFDPVFFDYANIRNGFIPACKIKQ